MSVLDELDAALAGHVASHDASHDASHEQACAEWFAEAMDSVRDLLDGSYGGRDGRASYRAEGRRAR